MRTADFRNVPTDAFPFNSIARTHTQSTKKNWKKRRKKVEQKKKRKKRRRRRELEEEQEEKSSSFMQNVSGVAPEVFRKCDHLEGNKFNSVLSRLNG